MRRSVDALLSAPYPPKDSVLNEWLPGSLTDDHSPQGLSPEVQKSNLRFAALWATGFLHCFMTDSCYPTIYSGFRGPGHVLYGV